MRVLYLAAVTILVISACNGDDSRERSIPAATSISLESQHISTLPCRFSRLGAARLVRLLWLWELIGADADDLHQVHKALQQLSNIRCEEKDESIEDEMIALDARIQDAEYPLVARLASELGISDVRAQRAFDALVARGVDDLREACNTPEESEAWSASEGEFESQFERLALGDCGTEEGNASSMALALPETYEGIFRSCIADFLDSAHPDEDCGGPLSAGDDNDEETDGDKKSEDAEGTDETEDVDEDEGTLAEDQTIDENGNGIITIDKVGGGTVEYWCSGPCRVDSNGRVINATHKLTGGTRSDGVIYVVVQAAGANGVTHVYNRSFGSPSGRGANDDAGADSSISRTTWLEVLDDLVEQANNERENDFFEYDDECLVMRAQPGLDITYLVGRSDQSPIGREGSKEDRLRALDLVAAAQQCACEATEATMKQGRLRKDILRATCPSAADRERMECVRLPADPDDAPRCMELAKKDLALVAERRRALQCRLITCPPGSLRAPVRMAGMEACACLDSTHLRGVFEGRAHKACASLECGAGACTCQNGICGCSDPLKDHVSKVAPRQTRF